MVQVNSCTANATAGAYEYLVKRYLTGDAYDVSRLFIYYCARIKVGLSSDTAPHGSFIRG